jgi:hypothetical protein
MNEIINNEPKENVSHLSFEEYFESDWRKHFQETDAVQSILDASGLSDSLEFVQINSRYLIDDNRVAVIALIKRKNSKLLEKLIIDVIEGDPSFEQLMDVIYNVGADCEYRVVLYDHNVKYKSHDVNLKDSDLILKFRCDYYHPVVGSMLTSLMEKLSGHAFLTVIGIDLEVNESNSVTFQYTNIESISKDLQNIDVEALTRTDFKYPKFPDRSIFERAEFWGPYFLPAHRHYWSCTEYDFDMSSYEEDCGDNMTSFACWEYDEMYVEYKIAEEDINWLLTNKAEEMKNFFDGWSIEYRMEERRTTVKKDLPLQDIISAVPDENNYSIMGRQITIHRPIPFRNFINSLPDQKHELAEEFAVYATSVLYFSQLLEDREDI